MARAYDQAFTEEVTNSSSWTQPRLFADVLREAADDVYGSIDTFLPVAAAEDLPRDERDRLLRQVARLLSAVTGFDVRWVTVPDCRHLDGQRWRGRPKHRK